MQSNTLLLVSIGCSLLWVASSVNSKYSQDVNLEEKLEDRVQPFRMKKTNLIWSKARLRLHGKKLAEAYKELERHDKREAELKKMKATGVDKAGKMAEKVLQSYNRLIELYGLDNEVPKRRRNEIDELEDHEMTSFDDPKLQSMWLRAREAGFSGGDLSMLKQEFEHQQMKIDEFNYIHGEEAKNRGSDNNINEKIEEEDLKPDRKERKNDIHSGYMHLEKLSRNLPRTGTEFKDFRVNAMWDMAKKTNWTQEQLESFKEELSHLEHKMLKQNHYAEKVKDSMKKFNNNPDSMPEHHKHVYDTSQLLDKRVNKLHGEMKRRIDKALRHEEL